MLEITGVTFNFRYRQLAKMAEPLETKQYRALMRDHVPNLREYGLAFLGPYSAVVGRSPKRVQDGAWVVTDKYGADQDEKCRDLLYRSQSS
jgi:hypothetical protein